VTIYVDPVLIDIVAGDGFTNEILEVRGIINAGLSRIAALGDACLNLIKNPES